MYSYQVRRNFRKSGGGGILRCGRGLAGRVPADASFRMDLGALEALLDKLALDHHAVLAVVGIVGTPGSGSVDPVDGILQLRDRHVQTHGRWFFVHVGAAYGGYARALFRRFDGSFRNFMEPKPVCAVAPAVYRAFQSMTCADSVALDSHALGFAPDPAGALIIRDANMRSALADSADHPNADDEDHRSGYVLEGDRSGSVACAVWLAHQTVPLDEGGYGALLGEVFSSAQGLAEWLDGRCLGEFVGCVLAPPDLDVVLCAFAPRKPAMLHRVNAINEEVLSRFSANRAEDFSLAGTRLTHHRHGRAPVPFLKRLGIPGNEWRSASHLLLLRCATKTALVADSKGKAFYRQELARALESLLGPSELHDPASSSAPPTPSR